MTNIYVRKTDFGWQWNETLTAGYAWHSFNNTVRTHADMIAFFRGGGHRNTQNGNFDAPRLTLVDQDNNVMQHYKVKIDNNGGLHSAVTNYDDSKKKLFTTAQLWSESDQLAYLRQSAVNLPEEYDTVKSALSFLESEEPFTVADYRDTLKQKLTAKITAELKQHSTANNTVIEYTE